MEEAWSGKVGGLLSLETALIGSELDLFLLCSSLGSFLPGSRFGQVGYASANAYLDAAGDLLVRRHGWPVKVVNWDDFCEGGMSVKAAASRGLKAPDSSSGLTNLQVVEATAQILVSPHQRLAVTVHQLPMLMQQINGHTPPVTSSTSRESKCTAVSTSSHASESHANSLLAAIMSAFGMVLGEEEINEETNFFLAGGHSLLALQVIGQIREEQRLEIGLLDLFEAPTPRLLATRLIQRLSNLKRA